tara:strand:- start:1483 stop:3438 length:1956 start_codon:yes stop_codon:yes gene_type:complete
MATPEQEAALQRTRQRMADDVSNFGVVEPQRARSVAQGTTLGGADEIEARARAMAGEDYETALKDIRLKLSEYRQESPIASAGYELAGGFIPAIAAAITKKPVNAQSLRQPAATLFTKFLPNLAKMAGIGAVEGGVTAALSSDQTLREQMTPEGLYNIGIGSTIGAGTSGAIYTGGLGVLKAGQKVSDFLAMVSGSRARTAVTNELQRIASEAGISPDEAFDRVMRGEILAEDPTVAGMVRAYRSEGGKPAAAIYEGMGGRPAQTQGEAVETIRGGVAKGLSRNLVKQARSSDQQLAKLERVEYESAFQSAGDASQEVVDEMYSVMRRYPTGGKKLAAAFTSETGRTPFFSIDTATNKISFNMPPTMKDAEILRRIIVQEGDALIAKGGADATIGINIKDASNTLRKSIDVYSPEIAMARSNAADRRATSSAFQNGRKAMSKASDDVELEFNDIVNTGNADAVEAYRLGYLANMKSRMSSGAGKSMMGRLSDEASKEGSTLRMIFPADRLEEALEKIGVAAQSRSSTSRVLGGSETAATTMQRERIGTVPESITNSRLAADAIQGNMSAAINVLSRIVKQFQPNISEAEKLKVVSILLSQDPQIVRNALTDKTALASLRDKIAQIGEPIIRAASMASAIPATIEDDPLTKR